MATIRYRWGLRGYVVVGLVSTAIAAAVGFRGETLDGAVVRVIDGDTIAVQGQAGEIMVRLWGIDAPEHDQAFGNQATEGCRKLCLTQTVHLVVVDTDQYKRRVCKVLLPSGQDLGDEMIRRGFAWWSSAYAPRDYKKRNLQNAARTAKIGLWAFPPIIEPSAWRHRRSP